MRFEIIARERWHNRFNHSGNLLMREYGTPGGWFKRSLFPNDYRGAGISNFNQYWNTIRAAAVFTNRARLTLLTDVPYSLIIAPGYKPWRMIIVSADDPEAWIDRARLAGATAWWLAEPGPVFKYTPVDHTEPELDLIPEKTQRRIIKPREPYDREAVVREIKQGRDSLVEIAERHRITTETVYKINRGLREARDPDYRRTGSGRISVDPALEAAICADVLTGQMTRPMIARKNNTTIPVVMKVVRDNRLKTLPRGYAAQRIARQKKSP